MNLQSLTAQVYKLYWSRSATGEARYASALGFVRYIEALGRQDSRDLTPIDLPNYAMALEASRKASTVNKRIRDVIQVLKYGHSIGEVPESAWAFYRPLREEDQGRAVLSERQEQAMLDHLSPAYEDLFVFLIETGLRVSEALDLQLEDVHLNDAAERPWIEVRKSKTGRSRKVPLTARAELALRYSVGLRQLQRNARWAPEEPVFDLDKPFDGITYERFHYAFGRAKKEAGLTDERLTPHSLRHTCATRLLRSGVNVVVVQKWLGHSDISSTLRYVHTDTSDLEAAAAAME